MAAGLTIATALAGVVAANVVASLKSAERTHQVMYTVGIAFAWDLFIIQTLCAAVQAFVILNLGQEEYEGRKRITGFKSFLVNEDILCALQ